MNSQQAISIIVAIIASAFFSGVEMAFVSANKLYFELQAKQGVITGQIISKYLKNPSKFIGTMLIGNTLSLVAYGIFMEGFLHHEIEHYFPILNGLVAGLIASFIGTVIILMTSEFTPKSIQTKDERANLVYAIKIKTPNDGLLKIGMYGDVTL